MDEGDDLSKVAEVLTANPIGGMGACTLPQVMRSKPRFSSSAEPNVASLNSTSSVLPQNQMPCDKAGHMPPPPP